MRLLLSLVAALLGAVAAEAAGARAEILHVGPERALKLPSDAARLAKPGDSIEIDPGEYVDCAVLDADRLTVAGRGTVVIKDKVCRDMALFVTAGDDITIRGVTLMGARATPGNGAGIRAGGRNLTVERVRFVDNENGILAGKAPRSTITVVESEFLNNGTCAGSGGCAHGIYATEIARLRVERSRFSGTRQGHHIKSRAPRTEIVETEIRDGPHGTASYLVDLPNGGDLVMENNLLDKGPASGNPTAAVAIGAEGMIHRSTELVFRRNRFVNAMASRTLFVWNLSGTPATLIDNSFTGPVDPEGSVPPKR